jgi:hypothetical protein
MTIWFPVILSPTFPAPKFSHSLVYLSPAKSTCNVHLVLFLTHTSHLRPRSSSLPLPIARYRSPIANIQAFYAPLLDILDDKALTVIFANIEDLLLTATSFLSELEQRQKACRLYIDVIGDILEEHMGRMRVYMVCLRGR